MLPIDLTEVFQSAVVDERPPSGRLRCSSDLTGSLRHSQLRLANAPTNAKEVVAEIRALHGELWHEWFHDTLEKTGYPFFHEVKLNDWLPEGWGGRADWVFWHPRYKAFVLGDFKTSRGEAMYWIERNGAKTEHIWQMSAYWHALVKMGLPMVKGFAILYWPMNDVPGEGVVLPSVQECEPVPEEQILTEMSTRWEKSTQYLKEFSKTGELLNDLLEPTISREQKLFWNKTTKVFDLKLVPHWSTRFCPYPDELCDCSSQGTTKIGQYVYKPVDVPSSSEWGYEARKGYEDVAPTESPSKAERLRRKKEALADG